MKPSQAVALISLALTLLGCASVEHPPFRGNLCKDEFLSKNTLPEGDEECFLKTGEDECSTDKTNPKYRLAYVELSENGNYAEPCQLDRAIALIDEVNLPVAKREKEPGAIIVTFVHGWRNDASPQNEKRKGKNLNAFKDVLIELAEGEESRCKVETDKCRRRPVVGVYVAWRGDSLRTPKWLDFLDLPTFWARNNVANQIASSPIATQAILTLLKTAQENPKSRSIVVGHSMGALLLERAVSQALITMVIDALYQADKGTEIPKCASGALPVCENQGARAQILCTDGSQPVCRDESEPGVSMAIEYQAGQRAEIPRCASGALPVCENRGAQVQVLCTDQSRPVCKDGSRPGGRYFTPPADLIVLVNSAAPAQQSEHLRQTLEMGVEFIAGQEAQAGRSGPLVLSVTAQNDNATKRAFPLGVWFANQGRHFSPAESGGPSPKRLASHTAGHLKELHTHKTLGYQESSVRCEGETSSPYVRHCDNFDDSLVFTVDGEDEDRNDVTRRYSLTKRAEIRSPYWILQVPPEVIDGHSDIFVRPFIEFLQGFIAVATSKEKTLVIEPTTLRPGAQSPQEEPE